MQKGNRRLAVFRLGSLTGSLPTQSLRLQERIDKNNGFVANVTISYDFKLFT